MTYGVTGEALCLKGTRAPEDMRVFQKRKGSRLILDFHSTKFFSSPLYFFRIEFEIYLNTPSLRSCEEIFRGSEIPFFRSSVRMSFRSTFFQDLIRAGRSYLIENLCLGISDLANLVGAFHEINIRKVSRGCGEHETWRETHTIARSVDLIVADGWAQLFYMCSPRVLRLMGDVLAWLVYHVPTPEAVFYRLCKSTEPF